MAKAYDFGMSKRVLNRLMGGMMRVGLGPKDMYQLTVDGCASGRPRTTPVFCFEHGGDRWIVSPYGEREWVKNTRAAGAVGDGSAHPQARLRRGRRVESLRLEEVDAATAAPVLLAYLDFAGYPRPYFDVSKDSPLADVEAEAPRHPVFRVHAA